MAVEYISFIVSIHGLRIAEAATVEKIKSRIKAAVRKSLTHCRAANFKDGYDNDIDIALKELSGRFDQ